MVCGGYVANRLVQVSGFWVCVCGFGVDNGGSLGVESRGLWVGGWGVGVSMCWVRCY